MKKKPSKDILIYTLKIAYNENSDTIEYIKESIDDNPCDFIYYDSDFVYIFDYYNDEDLHLLDDTLVIGEA